MIKSMTGYGRSEAAWQGKKIIVEMKSVNHRFLEISLRLPTVLFPMEAELKKKITEKCKRGRIEVSIRMEEENNSTAKAHLNLEAARGYFEILSRIKEEFKLSDEVSLRTLASFRDIFTTTSEVQLSDDLVNVVNDSLREALSVMVQMRREEGIAMYEDMQGRLGAIRGLIDEIKARAPQVVFEYQKRLAERIKELTSGYQMDEGRLVQEVAIMAERSDITEEIVRLQSHIKQFEDLLQSDEAEGKKIDFLLQEMNREINTSGSKSNDLEIARRVIEAKSEMSKLREQAQNIE
ncbi:MAG TPA: YicC family protein [Smithellaceae bacterium]|nr:YicC family protein [Smithellaceae bacterium]HRS89264.1 YicC family protein [Smithellaceae bacterium]HRV26278.1 YicC family protein [Smithellaceae bacterium]